MQKFQIYIGDDRLDLFKDESITVTQSIQNVKQIDKIFTEFSQTFSVPASPTNNKIFKHYYNYDIVNGYDARVKSAGRIEFNFLTWRNGFITLNGTRLKNQKPYSYKITFFGETVNLKDILADDQLSVLTPLNNFNLDYTATEINSKLTGSITSAKARKNGASSASIDLVVDNNSGTIAVGDVVNCEGVSGIVTIINATNQNSLIMSSAQTIADDVQIRFSKSICTPLITHTERLYYNSTAAFDADNSGNLFYASAKPLQGVLFSELKYAIRVHTLVQAIESYYTTANGFSKNIVFSQDFFNFDNSEYFELFMWLHRKSGAVEESTQIPIYNSLVNVFTISTSNIYAQMIADGSSSDSTQTSTLRLYAPAVTSNTLTVTVEVGSASSEFQVVVLKNGSAFFNSTFSTTGASIPTTSRTFTTADLGIMQPGTYTIQINQTSTAAISFTSIEWDLAGNVSGTAWSKSYTTSAVTFATTSTFEFNIAEQIPEQTVINFLTGLFKLFNLTAFVEDDVIVVKTLDEYYQQEETWSTTDTFWNLTEALWNEAGTSGATTYSIDEFMDVESGEVDVALPFKQINFKYEGLGTFLAKQYEELQNIGWGTIDYTLDSEVYDAPTEIFEVTVPFEHMQFERLIDAATTTGIDGGKTDIQVGFFVNENQQPFIGKPLLFYPIQQTSSTSLSFRNTTTTNQELTSYIIPSNSLKLRSTLDASNLNFKLEFNEFTLDDSFTGTLFKTYYETYVSEIFHTQRRIIKVSAFLPFKIIYQIELYDSIEINGRLFRINSMTTNFQTGKTDFELINLL